MRFGWDLLKTMPGTKPPPSIRTFFQVYGSEAAACAPPPAATRATAAAPAASTAEIAPASFLRMCLVLLGMLVTHGLGKLGACVSRATSCLCLGSHTRLLREIHMSPVPCQ